MKKVVLNASHRSPAQPNRFVHMNLTFAVETRRCTPHFVGMYCVLCVLLCVCIFLRLHLRAALLAVITIKFCFLFSKRKKKKKTHKTHFISACTASIRFNFSYEMYLISLSCVCEHFTTESFVIQLILFIARLNNFIMLIRRGERAKKMTGIQENMQTNLISANVLLLSFVKQLM